MDGLSQGGHLADSSVASLEPPGDGAVVPCWRSLSSWAHDRPVCWEGVAPPSPVASAFENSEPPVMFKPKAMAPGPSWDELMLFLKSR